MLPLDDPRWKTYKAGYRVTYDASFPLRHLLTVGPSPEIWKEFWQELHHQGDVDAASYAAVPYLVEFLRRSERLDWNPIHLIAVIELERPNNPPPPPEIEKGYFHAIEELPSILIVHPHREWDEGVMSGAATCIALARGQRQLARIYFDLTLESAKSWLRYEFGTDTDYG